MSPTRNRPGLIASIVIALLAAAWSACTDSPPPAPTASPTPTATASPTPTATASPTPTATDVTGLAPGGFYVFEVRPWLRVGAGAASEDVDGFTATIGSDGIAMEEPWFCLERGRRFRIFGSDFTFVVPHRMLLCTGQAGNTTASVVTVLYDETTRARASLDPRTGEIVAETFWDANTNSYKGVYRPTGEIVRSWMELPPPPGYDLSALWDEIEQSIRREPLP